MCIVYPMSRRLEGKGNRALELKKKTSATLATTEAELGGLKERHAAQSAVLTGVQASEEALSAEVAELKVTRTEQKTCIDALTEEGASLTTALAAALEEQEIAVCKIDTLEGVVARLQERVRQLEEDATEHADRLGNLSIIVCHMSVTHPVTYMHCT